VNVLDALPLAAVTAGQLHTARWLAGAAFLGLLALLGLGLHRMKRLLLVHEAEAALDADFQRLRRSRARKGS
jgi:hypothetical protein